MNKSFCYIDFVQKTINDHDGLSSDITSGAKMSEASNILLKASNSYSYMIDYRTGGYIYMSDTFKEVVDYPVQLLKKEGLWHYLRLIHPQDRKIINENIFGHIIKFLAGTVLKPDLKYRFIFNYRIQKPNGDILTIRQINNFIKVDNFGRPLVNMGVCTVIPFPVPDHKITFLAQSQNSHQTWENEDVKTFIPDQTLKSYLSPSELKVLHWIRNGYNSERIAEALNRSLHTIKTHRKNMLEKTKCKNTAELLQYSLAHGIG